MRSFSCLIGEVMAELTLPADPKMEGFQKAVRGLHMVVALLDGRNVNV